MYLFIYALLILGIYLFIKNMRYLLLRMRDIINHDRYTLLVDNLLASMDSQDGDIFGIFIGMMHLLSDRPRYIPTRYIGEDTPCAISRTTIHNGASIITLPCGHFAKEKYMTRWILSHTTCPICRAQC